jgi:hypothetical protein
VSLSTKLPSKDADIDKERDDFIHKLGNARKSYELALYQIQPLEMSQGNLNLNAETPNGDTGLNMSFNLT